MAIRTLIVDDEPHAINILQSMRHISPILEIVATCNNAIKASGIAKQYNRPAVC